ncbi:MAG TPA: type IVB secretion system apparatus protein IcmL/DotI [Patescibacteria group bacterium]|nr:type IVB secretion system apparatus protein IcmL/DotI [Patescibacteria group bacterium]
MANTENENMDEPQEAAEAVNAPPEVTSPLASFVKGLGGGKKNTATAVAKTPAPPSLAKGGAVAKPGAVPAGKNIKPPPISGPLVTIVTRNEFYRDGFRNLIKIAVLEGIVIIGLILTLIVYMNNAQPSDRYFATTADGRIMQLQPLDQPNLDTPALLSWLATAVVDTMSFSYLNYQKELQDASKSFTKTGWESFTNALQKSHILDSVQSLQQIVTTTPRSAPVLVQQGVLNGKYRWILKMPIAVKYQAAKDSRTDNLDLQLVVERVPSLENPSGVGIAQWIATAKQ